RRCRQRLPHEPRLYSGVERLARRRPGGWWTSYVFATNRATGNRSHARRIHIRSFGNPALATLSYPTADIDPAHARLTVRERENDSRAAPSDLSVKFEGSNRIAITRPAGFDAGAIYEFIYLAKDPKVMGLGFAAT